MHKHVARILTLIIITTVYTYTHAQLAFDTLLFRISLSEDTTYQSLFVCHETDEISRTLSGPVVMKDDNLLFYSNYGYIVYNQKGAILDSHSVFQKNRGLSPNDPNRIQFGFPVDRSTLLYFQKVSKGEYPLTIYAKKLYKNRLKPLKEKNYQYFSSIDNECLFNLAHNTITDDMAATYFAQPCLIGFSSLNAGNKWWSLDKFYTFSSPLIIENKGKYQSFFPGIRAGKLKRKHQFVTPVQIFSRDNNWFYTGVHSNIGTMEEAYSQTFFVCDNAGNILYTDNLLKQTNRDAIIGEDEDTYYTMKKVEQFVFQPTVDGYGNVYYGIIDYVKKYIKVRKRGYYVYYPISSEPDFAHLIDMEKGITYTPVAIHCNTKLQGGKTIPQLTFLDAKAKRIVAKARHLTKDGYIVRIFRSVYRDIDRKLSRSRAALPEEVNSIKESLANMSTVSCPYTISLSGPKGMIRTFNYPPGVEVVCARVLVLQDSTNVLVRVDCDAFAEILIFKTDGDFVNRFVFNTQHYSKRKDIVVATSRSAILELDFELGNRKKKFLKWEKGVIQ